MMPTWRVSYDIQGAIPVHVPKSPPPAISAPAAHTDRMEAAAHAARGAATPWDWAPLRAWLELPRHHPTYGAALLTAPRRAGCTVASACAALALQPHILACHFCSPCDARSKSARHVVHSLAYQLACRVPLYSKALWGVLEVCDLVLPNPSLDDALVEEAVNTLITDPLTQVGA
jgi:hypothetical protein